MAVSKNLILKLKGVQGLDFQALLTCGRLLELHYSSTAKTFKQLIKKGAYQDWLDTENVDR